MDPRVLQRIADGKYAESVLEVFGELLDALAEESLRSADALRADRKLTPDLAQAILYEVGAYRTIKSRLQLRVRRAEHLQAAALAEAHATEDDPALKETLDS